MSLTLDEIRLTEAQKKLRDAWGQAVGSAQDTTPTLFADPEFQGIMRKKRESLSGFDSQEMQRMRDVARAGSQAQEQAGVRRLVAQQRRMGGKGGVAQQGLANLQTEAQRARQDSENKIMQLQRQEQQTALNEYQKMFQGASEFDLKNVIKTAGGIMTGGVGISTALAAGNKTG